MNDQNYFYTVLITRRLPNPFLLYRSDKIFKIGQIVMVPLRKQLILGLIWQDVEQNKLPKDLEITHIQIIRSLTYGKEPVLVEDVDKVLDESVHESPLSNDQGALKPVKSRKTKLKTKFTYDNVETLNYFNDAQIKYLKLIVSNSFNTADVALQTLLEYQNNLGTRDLKTLETTLQSFSESHNFDDTEQERMPAEPARSTVENKSQNEKLTQVTLQRLPEFISFSPLNMLQYIKIRIMNLIRSYINVYSNRVKDKLSQEVKFDSGKTNLKTTNSTVNLNVLFVFPEKKLLEKYLLCLDLKNLKNEISLELSNINVDIEVLKFSGDKTKNSKQTVTNLLTQKFTALSRSPKNITNSDIINHNAIQTNIAETKMDQIFNTKMQSIKQEQTQQNYNTIPKPNNTSYNLNNISDNQIVSDNLDFQVNLYFTTKAGLFLPFETLDEVYLIDESNSMYIQDQNSFYYDAREIVYFLAQVHKAQLYIVSSFESVRMFNYKKEQNIKESEFNLNNPADNNSISSETETTIGISTESKASYNVEINEEKNINTLETDSNIVAPDNINIKVSERTPQNMAPNGIFSWEIEKLLLKDVD